MKRKLIMVVPAVLVLGVLLGLLLRPGRRTKAVEGPLLAAAQYPDIHTYSQMMDASEEELAEFQEEWESGGESLNKSLDDGLDSFLFESAASLWMEAEPGENRLVSPLNFYMNLAMLAEVTSGEAQEKILELLCCESLEDLRVQEKALWMSNNFDESIVCQLANSVWLSDRLDYNQEALDHLAEDHFASSYWGEMGSEEYDQLLHSWLNEQTGDLLAGPVGNLQMDPETLFNLVSTVFYQATWSNEFNPKDNREGVFHAPGPDGQLASEEACTYMNREQTGLYYWGDSFGACAQGLGRMNRMLFLLPDEGVAPEDLLDDPQVIEFLTSFSRRERTEDSWSEKDWKQCRFVKLHFSVPKFDISQECSLISGFQALGLGSLFQPGKADFSPLVEKSSSWGLPWGADECVLGKVDQASRLMIDEKGCTGTSFIASQAGGASAPPNEKVEFTLDRPFLFVLLSNINLPIYIGIVNHPG